MWKGFRDFILRGPLIELAVAVVIGTAFGQVVASFVSDVLMPAIGALGQIPDFSAIKVGPVSIGKFINAVVNFLIIAAAIYFLVILPVSRLKKKKDTSVSPPEPAEEVKLLRAILDELKRKS